MGVADLRSAMEAAGLRIADVRLRYEVGRQVIDVSGWHPDGTPFSRTSDPFDGEPIAYAAAMARSVVASRRLTADIVRGADRIASATVIAKALVEGRKHMGLAEKAKTLAERAHAVPKAIEARLDSALSRLDAVERTGGAACDGLEAHVGEAEAAVAATESAVRAISNAPLGEGSKDS